MKCLPDIIDVRWMTRREPANITPENSVGLMFTKAKNWERSRKFPVYETQSWREYMIASAEGKNTILRVWVNGELVWFYERGWFIDPKTYIPSTLN